MKLMISIFYCFVNGLPLNDKKKVKYYLLKANRSQRFLWVANYLLAKMLNVTHKHNLPFQVKKSALLVVLLGLTSYKLPFDVRKHTMLTVCYDFLMSLCCYH